MIGGELHVIQRFKSSSSFTMGLEQVALESVKKTGIRYLGSVQKILDAGWKWIRNLKNAV